MTVASSPPTGATRSWTSSATWRGTGCGSATSWASTPTRCWSTTRGSSRSAPRTARSREIAVRGVRTSSGRPTRQRVRRGGERVVGDLESFEQKYSPGLAPPPQPLSVSIANIREVLAHTEIVETDQGDLIASPDQVWLIPKGEQQTLSWEVNLSEEQFWTIVGAVWGLEIVREMKEELNDWLRWEEEGGPCLS